MSSRNHLFPGMGTREETNTANDLIEECLKMYGQELYYIPRQLVDVDQILGEDRLSKFEGSYKIVCYLENIDNFGGAGAFMQKFGYTLEEQATFVVGRREWKKSVGVYGASILPDRPTEGDLVWFPLTNSLFEIKFVDHQGEGLGGFYQLGKLYVYRLKCELFQFSSERFDTGIDEVDNFALEQSFDVLQNDISNENGDTIITEDGNDIAQDNFAKKPQLDFDRTKELNEEADDIINKIEKNPFADF